MAFTRYLALEKADNEEANIELLAPFHSSTSIKAHFLAVAYHGMYHLSSNGPRSRRPAPLAGSVIDARKHNVIKYSLYARYVNDCKLGAEFTSDYKAFLLNNVTSSLK